MVPAALVLAQRLGRALGCNASRCMEGMQGWLVHSAGSMAAMGHHG